MTTHRALRALLPLLVGAIVAQISFVPSLRVVDGPLFQALRGARPPVAPTRDLLLLEIDPAALHEGGATPWSGATLAESLLLLYEMDSKGVVLAPQVEGEIFRGDDREETLRAAFDREFSLIRDNVTTLFDAIRTGSVRPKDSATYVGELGSLIDAGKRRLFSSAINGERADALLIEGASRLLGSVYRDPGPSPADGAVHATFTRLGVPEGQLGLGRAAFSAALDRLGNPTVEVFPDRVVLRGAVPGENAAPPGDRVLPRDGSGALLLDYPPPAGSGDYRRLSFEALLRHQRLERELYTQLAAMERTGYVLQTGTDLSPSAVYEYAAQRRAELLSDRGSGSSGGDWRALRERFFQSCDRFLNGDAEERILAGYDALMAQPTATEETKESLLGLKSAAANAFVRARLTLAELVALRSSLRSELERSLCLVAVAPEGRSPGADVAAALVDATLTGRSLGILPPRTGSLLSALFGAGTAILLATLGPVAAPVVGGVLALAAGGGAALYFFVSGIWFSPLVPAAVVLSVALASSLILWTEVVAGRRRLRRCLGGLPPPRALRFPSTAVAALEGRRELASILAVRAPGLSEYPPETDPALVAEAFRAYHDRMSRLLVEKGGVVYAAQGELVFAFFGPPFIEGDHRAAACGVALDLAGTQEPLVPDASARELPPGTGALRVGVDTGPCDLGSAGVPGAVSFSVFGPVPLRARLLSSLAERYGTSVLVSEGTREGLGERFQTVRLDKMVSRADAREDWFYRLSRGGSEAEEA